MLHAAFMTAVPRGDLIPDPAAVPLHHVNLVCCRCDLFKHDATTVLFGRTTHSTATTATPTKTSTGRGAALRRLSSGGGWALVLCEVGWICEMVELRDGSRVSESFRLSRRNARGAL